MDQSIIVDVINTVLESNAALEEPNSRIELLLLALMGNNIRIKNIQITLSKDTYDIGDSINYDDAIVVINLNNNKEMIISPKALAWSPSNNSIFDTPGPKTITATYTFMGIVKKWIGTVNVRYPITSIAVTKLPNKVKYNEGETIDFTGIEVTAYREDNSIDGLVPFNELEFPITVASIGE